MELKEKINLFYGVDLDLTRVEKNNDKVFLGVDEAANE